MSQYKNQIVSYDRSYYQGQTPSATYDAAVVAGIEGRECVIPRLGQTAPTGNAPETQVSGDGPTIRLVRNVHATTCAAGELVKVGATSGYLTQRTAGQSGSANEACLGVVHHRCSSGIPQHDIGPVVVRGPVWVKKVSGALTVGQRVVASGTAGSVQAFTDTDTDDQTGAIVNEALNIVGYVLTDAASGDAMVEIFVGQPQP